MRRFALVLAALATASFLVALPPGLSPAHPWVAGAALFGALALDGLALRELARRLTRRSDL